MKNKKYYFIGIGGSGVSGIAEILIKLGANVSGSDKKESSYTKHLKEIGATVYIGHDASNIDKTIDVVVYSNAIGEDNNEMKKALELLIPLIPRAEMLSEILRIKRPIGIAGTHGKTTTTSMVAYIFSEAKFDPSFIIGGVSSNLSSNAHLGKGEFFIYEACEAFDSLNYVIGEAICITNIDNDHLEYFLTMDNLLQSFLNYINRIPFYGVAVLNGDNFYIKSLIPKIKKRFILFGLDDHNDIIATNIKNNGFSSTFDVVYKKKFLETFTITIPGKHNILNTLGAIGVALSLKVPLKDIKESLFKFKLPQQRFQLHGKFNDALVVEDFAHHPTEIRVTLDAAIELKSNQSVKRIITAFQPTLFSRTELLHKHFATELSKTDLLLLVPIYGGREINSSNIDLSIITNDLDEIGYNNYLCFDSLESLTEYVKTILEPEDLFLVIGTGNINEVIRNLVI